MWKILSTILLISLIASCTNKDEQKGSDQQLKNYTVSNDRIAYLDSITTMVEIFKIPYESTLKIGYQFEEVFLTDEDNLILIDRRLSTISCVDESGQVLWQATPPEPGIDRYEQIGNVDFIEKTQEIFIEDRFNLKIDVYGFNGSYKRSIDNQQIPFLGFSTLNGQNIIYDVSDENIDNYDELDYTPNFLYVDNNQNRNYLALSSESSKLEEIPVDFKNRFNKVNNQVQYRKPFGNVIYSIDQDFSIQPIAKFSMTNEFNFTEIVKDENIPSTYAELWKNELPIPYLSIYAPHTESLCFSYYKNTELLFSCSTQDQQYINPSHFYYSDNYYFPPPKFYSQGKFFTSLFKYEYDYLQMAIPEGEPYGTIFNKLVALRKEYGDKDEVYLIFIDATPE